MKTFLGIALGFSLMPTVVGLIFLFAWLSMRFELSRSATALGGALGVATLIVAAGVALFMTLSRS